MQTTPTTARGQKVLLEDMERNAELDIWNEFGTDKGTQNQYFRLLLLSYLLIWLSPWHAALAS
jgi:hypothetical protein